MRVWHNPWVVGEEGRFITSTPVESISMVSDLIDSTMMEWYFDLISTHFNERDRQCILSIPLSMRVPHDSLTWDYSNDGLYSTKIAYMLGKGGNLDNLHLVWKEVWGMEASPKVKHFFWRFCTNRLPTRELLKHRHLVEDARCSCCGLADESSYHALFRSSEYMPYARNLGVVGS